MPGGDPGDADSRSIGRILLAVAFLGLFVVAAVGFGVAENRHTALLPKDADERSHAGVTAYEFVNGSDPAVRVTFELRNPTRAPVVVERPETAVGRLGEERVAQLPVASYDERRLSAGETATWTVDLTVTADDASRVRSGVAERRLAIGGLFLGRVGEERVQIPIVRGVPADE